MQIGSFISMGQSNKLEGKWVCSLIKIPLLEVAYIFLNTIFVLYLLACSDIQYFSVYHLSYYSIQQIAKKSKSDCTFTQDEKAKDFQVKICTTDSSKRFGIAIFKVLWKYESVRDWQEMMLPKKTSHSVPWRRRWHKMMMKINMQKGL